MKLYQALHGSYFKWENAIRAATAAARESRRRHTVKRGRMGFWFVREVDNPR